MIRHRFDRIAGRLFALCAGILVVYLAVLYARRRRRPAPQLRRHLRPDAGPEAAPGPVLRRVLGPDSLLGHRVGDRGDLSAGAGRARAVLDGRARPPRPGCGRGLSCSRRSRSGFSALSSSGTSLPPTRTSRSTRGRRHRSALGGGHLPGRPRAGPAGIGLRRPVILLSLAWLGLLAVLTYWAWGTSTWTVTGPPYLATRSSQPGLLLLTVGRLEPRRIAGRGGWRS